MDEVLETLLESLKDHLESVQKVYLGTIHSWPMKATLCSIFLTACEGSTFLAGSTNDCDHRPVKRSRNAFSLAEYRSPSPDGFLSVQLLRVHLALSALVSASQSAGHQFLVHECIMIHSVVSVGALVLCKQRSILQTSVTKQDLGSF